MIADSMMKRKFSPMSLMAQIGSPSVFDNEITTEVTTLLGIAFRNFLTVVIAT